MSKLAFLTDMKDYCVCENINLRKKPRGKIGIKSDIKLKAKKITARQKYEFPEKKFLQLERFFLNTPRRQMRQQRNKERSKPNNKPKKIVKQQTEQFTQEDWPGNKQYQGHNNHNRTQDELNDIQPLSCEENRLQEGPAE